MRKRENKESKSEEREVSEVELREIKRRVIGGDVRGCEG
jgi:hypothetical protein